jgi:hypothetical protein
LSEIIGHVDAQDRPIVSLSAPDQEDSFPVVIDTGFNGQLLIYSTEIARFRCEHTDLTVTAEFADRQRHLLSRARSRIIWFGGPRAVDVLIATADQPRSAPTDEPIGLLGTGLLSPHKLTVDFARRRVVIDEGKE